MLLSRWSLRTAPRQELEENVCQLPHTSQEIGRFLFPEEEKQGPEKHSNLLQMSEHRRAEQDSETRTAAAVLSDIHDGLW